MKGSLPPGLFQTEAGLRSWVYSNGLLSEPLKGIRQTDAVLVRSPAGSALMYEGVWVRAGSEMYRAAMCTHSRALATEETSTALRHLDADHVINRGNIARLYGRGWVDAWVFLFPAFGGPNRSFGTLEKKKLSYQPAASISIQPIHLLKMYVTRAPKSKKQMALARAVLEGQIVEGAPGQKLFLIHSAQTEYENIRPLQ